MCDNVARLAEGADVLVHEVIDLERIHQRIGHLDNADELMKHMREAHTHPRTRVALLRRRELAPS